jgi:hypothetical protein
MIGASECVQAAVEAMNSAAVLTFVVGGGIGAAVTYILMELREDYEWGGR